MDSPKAKLINIFLQLMRHLRNSGVFEIKFMLPQRSSDFYFNFNSDFDFDFDSDLDWQLLPTQRFKVVP
ncbi:hypothetical protein ACLKA6_004449 [Drosophila palustris]